ncbi:OmpA family protein [Falsiroseomonas oryziterrae]|uniref:OmpA family protein n=1 Tax=Falsiroseomonas oryziterrae TaxID=2911368 RepID=UPI001F249E71|nr:OmpA family protein [Roseomonas sp. NPKOSM-4]
MRFRNLLLASAVVLVPGAAGAQPLFAQNPSHLRGVYIAAGAGLNWLQESDLTSQGGLRSALGAAGVGQTGTADFDLGWVGVISLGYAFGNGIRVEIEGNYRENSINGISGFNGIAAPRNQGGDVSSYGVMANVFYDFDLGWNFGGFAIVPYLGAGAGYAVQNWDNVRINAPTTGRSVTIDGDNGNFAWQVIAGAAFPIASVPGLAFTAEGRYFATLSDDVDATFVSTTGVATRQAGSVEVDNGNWSLMVGLRYTFGVAPPPPVVAPAPAAAPAPARTFLVFFDWNRADLTERARQIIGDAATNAQRGGVSRIEVSGHADRSGTPQYNQRLSERRANAVAAELERRGIPRSAITIQGFGESRPLVPTADGVREPQNRRVEIVLR